MEPGQYIYWPASWPLGARAHVRGAFNPFNPHLLRPHPFIKARERMSYSKFNLPVLKLTHRPTTAPKTVTFVHRSSSSHLDSVPVDYSGLDSGPELGTLDHKGCFLEESSSSGLESCEPTEHELSCKSSVAGWEGIRLKLRTSVTEGAAMPLGQKCIMCEETACYRCQQCGPLGYFCSSCFMKLHSRINIFHVPEQWEVCILCARYVHKVKSISLGVIM